MFGVKLILRLIYGFQIVQKWLNTWPIKKGTKDKIKFHRREAIKDALQNRKSKCTKSSLSEVFFKKSSLKSFSNLQENTWENLFFNKMQAVLQPY